MSALFPAERVFSFSCLEGLRLLRLYGERHPDLATEELLTVILSVEADANSLDMEASIELSAIVASDCPLDGRSFYQGCIEAIIHQYRPDWLRLMRQGRARFLDRLSPDARDVFRAAGLLADPVSSEIVAWWDVLSGHSRLVSDRAKIDQGRAAEMLTLAHERRALEAIGIQREPEWPGLDDNFAGYDVLSYEMRSTGITNRMIEVKSTMASPMRFFVTRNEWRTAESAEDAYIFHVWNMSATPPQLHTRTVKEVMPHIPSNNGNGKWETATVPVTNH